MKKSRRAQEDIGFDAITIISIIFFVTFVFLSYVFFANAFFRQRTETAEAEAKIYAERMVFARECFAYYSLETGRTYPGIIDASNFTTERLEGCMNFSNPERAAAAAELAFGTNNREAFYNKEKFEVWKNLAGIPGSGSYEKYQMVVPVSVFDAGKQQGGIINITVVVPRG
ncbi:hypothetical protein COT07_01035 [Candidatus Woesearchaeota archaeon CG07_land_8_20_14_0_80_44_23]|nr:MAG: hypothetical protein COT07_01035 [Candidatus Woesearchaeota archaeon CG07_land_8_20_14_0_80_44_23]